MSGETLLALAERVESATEPSRILDRHVAAAVGCRYKERLTASLDAVLALCAEKLPGDTPTLVVLNVALSRLLTDIAVGRSVGTQVTTDVIARYALSAFLRALATTQPTEAADGRGAGS